MSRISRLPYLLLLLAVGVTSTPLIPVGSSARPLTLILVLPVLLFHIINRRGFGHDKLNIFIILLSIYLFLLQLFVVTNPDTRVDFIFKGESYSQDVASAFLSAVAFTLHYFAFKAAVIVLGTMRSIKAVVYGIMLSVFVGILQWILDRVGFAELANNATSIFSISAIVWQDRVRGLAFEPSWLASQITVFLIPLLVYQYFVIKKSFVVLNFHGRRVGLEVVFGGVGILALVLTFSRGGLVALLGTVTMLLLYLFKDVTKVKNIFRAILIVSAAFIMIYAASGNAYVASSMGGIQRVGNARAAFATANAGPRFAAWESAVNTFLRHPYFGVGLGLQHRYFAASPPPWSVRLPEVQAWLNPYVPDRANPKNILLKMLCESGIVGMILFAITFLLALLQGRNWTLALFMAPALLVDFFSLDSLALVTYPLALVLLSEVGRAR